jgi:hypothetical protein
MVTVPEQDSIEIRENVEDLELAWAAKIVRRGDMLYLAIHQSDAGFYDLRPGDRVLVKVVKVKRAKRPGRGGGDDM